MTAGRFLTIASFVAALLCPALSGAQTPTSTPCAPALEIADLEDMEIGTLRGGVDDFYYQAFVAGDISDRFGYVYDNNHIFVDEDSFAASPVAVWVGADAGPRAVQAGDFVRLTYDSGSTLDVYFPAVTGYGDDTFYVGADGSTYTDIILCTVAYTAPTPTATPSPTPTPTITSTPTITPTPYAPWPMFRSNVRRTGRSNYSGPSRCVLLWSYETGWPVESSPVIASGGRIHVGSNDNNLYAISSAGSFVWSYRIAFIQYNDKIWQSPAVGADGTVYVGLSVDNLGAINADGTFNWSYRSSSGGSSAHSSPALGTDGRIYMGAYANRIMVLTPTGSFVWSYETAGAVESSPAISSDGRIHINSAGINAAGHQAQLYVLTSEGALSWSYRSFLWDAASLAIGNDGRIHTGIAGWGSPLVLSSSGSFLWSYLTGALESAYGIGTDGTIYAGIESEYYAFGSGGSFLWSYRMGATTDSSPAIDSEGRIYVGPVDKNVYALDPVGSLIWSYQTGAYKDRHTSSPAIGDGRRLYVGSRDYRIYAFHDPTGDTFSNPIDISLPYAELDGSNAGFSNDYNSYSLCGWYEPGPDVVYRFTTGSTGTIDASGSSMSPNLDMFLCDGPSQYSCVQCGDDNLVYHGSAGTYYVVVDGNNGIAAGYELVIDFIPDPPTSTPTPTPTWDPAVPTYTPTSTPTETPIPTETPTPTQTPTPTVTPTPTMTSTMTPTMTPTPTLTPGALVNFQPVEATPAPRYLKDYGQDYGDQGEREYGWQ